MPELPGRTQRLVFVFLLLSAIVIGGTHAYLLRYVNDDCFVSFRYARNIVNGLGIVYNAEERVEGYTNFLWTMMIAGGMKLGIDPIALTTTLGIGAFLLTIALYGFLSLRLGKKTSALAFLPLTALALALHRDYCAHATSGMETSFFSLLLSAAYAVLVLGRTPLSSGVAGALFVLAMMTRPDGIIFLAAAGVYLLFTKEDVRRHVLALLLPAICLFVPYWYWRATYFGFFFPNTFYAKSIGLDYWSQGLIYAWLYIKTYPVIGAAIPAGVALLVVHFFRRRDEKPIALLRSLAPADRAILLALLFTIPYTLFIIRIGGDFMFARFFIPITPFCFAMIEYALSSLSGRAIPLLLAFVVLAGTWFRFDQYKESVFVGYVADEEQYFKKVEPLEQSQRAAEALKRHFHGMPVRLAFYAGQLRLIYYLDPPFAVESSSGLTDTAIAHQAVGTRERPGHEKHPTIDYLIKRRVHFYIGYTDPVPPGQVVLNAIRFDSIQARIITYDNRIMSVLERDSGVTFIHLPSYLDDYIAQMPTYSKRKVAGDYFFLKSFYFDINQDTARESRFLSYLNN